MRFKDFLDLTEAGTSTADIAGFSRITLPLVRRIWPNEVEELCPDYYDWNKKKKPYRVPQLEESVQRMARCPFCKQQFADQPELENFAKISCPHCGQMMSLGKARGVGDFIEANQGSILNRHQKQGIAAMLATNNLQGTLARLSSSGLPADLVAEGIAFAKQIDRFYKKRDGFVPRAVINLINTTS